MSRIEPREKFASISPPLCVIEKPYTFYTPLPVSMAGIDRNLSTGLKYEMPRRNGRVERGKGEVGNLAWAAGSVGGMTSGGVQIAGRALGIRQGSIRFN